jgi:hypothetical protein
MSVDALGQSFELMAAKGQLAVMQTMQATGEALRSVAESGGFTVDQLQRLMASPGMMTSQGLIGGTQFTRSQQESGIDMSMPALSQPKALQATIKLGDETIGVVTAAVNDTNEQISRRTSGVSGREASTGGRR